MKTEEFDTEIRKEQERYYDLQAAYYLDWSGQLADHGMLEINRNDWLHDCSKVKECLRLSVSGALRIADIGSGPSRLPMDCKADITFIDVSMPMLKEAQSRYSTKGCYINARSAALPLAKDFFDFVFCSQLLSHLPDKECIRSLYEMLRILAPGGTLLVVDSHKPSRGITNTNEQIQVRQSIDGRSWRVYKRYRPINWFKESFPMEAHHLYEGRFLFSILWKK